MTGETGSHLFPPGRLVLVVGPSGAGKDSLIRYARQRLAGEDAFVFPRRVVTRPSSDAEDNIEADELAFDEMSAKGAFAVAWDAHGLRYGIPAAVGTHLAEGRSVVCNVSRTTVAELRRRYANVLVIEVTAVADVRASRVAGRDRRTDGAMQARLTRSSEVRSEQPDVTLANDGPLERAGEAFLSVLTAERG